MPRPGVPQVHNLFAGIPVNLTEECSQDLLQTGHFRLERIVSDGQASPEGFWYDQPTHEWVVLLGGSAGLKFADRPDLVVLKPGDHLLIPAGCRHRVEWTATGEKTVWLALHFQAPEPISIPG